MAQFEVTVTDEKGIAGETQVLKRKIGKYQVGDKTVMVYPDRSAIEISPIKGNTDTLIIADVPDTRVVHTSLLAHILNKPPKVTITRTK